MNISPKEYSEMERRAAPASGVAADTLAAFVSGGCICLIGHIIRSMLLAAGAESDAAGTWTSVILIAAGAILTGLGWYQRLAKHAGAGTLVPITGFSNAISSSAVEAQTEGLVLGVGTKIFTIAGPVILYGCAASVVYGLIYYLLKSM